MSIPFTDCCRSCPCTRPAGVTRPPHADVAIVVDFPTDVEHKRDRFLQSDSGHLIRAVLAGHGLEVDDCYITSALNCRPPKGKEALLKKAMQSCKPRLIGELKKVGASKVLCLGPVGFSSLMSADKVLPITKVRGRWHQRFGWNILATFNPTMVMGENEFFRDLLNDVEKFTSMDGPDPFPDVEEWVLESVDELEEAFDFLQGASFVSCDVETTGFNPYRDKLLAVGFGVLYENGRDGVNVILSEDLLKFRETWAEIDFLLRSEDQATVFHNAKFDLKFLRRGLEEHGFEYEFNRIEDTMLLHYLLDERPMGRFQSHSLKNMARVYCDAPDYDIQMGKWLKAWADANADGRRRLRKQMHTYLALDCYYTGVLFTLLPPMIMEESPSLYNVYDNLLIPGSLALADVEYHGALLDRAFYEKTSKSLARRSAPILKRLQQNTGKDDFNPNSPKQVKEYVYDILGMPLAKAGQHTARRGKLKEGATAKAVLKSLVKKFPERDPDGIIADVLQYRNLTKNAGTYVNGMLTRIDDDDRIRGDFLPHGTATGRLSSSNPNLQNIPEASHTKVEVRNGFIAPPGYGLIAADYSQLELRIAAHLSDDDNFCQMFIEGRDPHQEVAYAFFQKPAAQVTAYERYMAKCVNFGVIYDRGAESIAHGPEMEHVVEIGGKRWSTEEVSEFFDKFFGQFPAFQEWREKQKAWAYKHQYVESPLGRRRRFPMIPRYDAGAVGRQAVNTPIQGTASDFTLNALIAINRRLKPLPAHIVTTIHDSIMTEARLDYIDEVAEIMREEMEQNVPFKSRVPFEVEIKVGNKWGDLEKVSDLPSDLFAEVAE